MIEPPSKRLVDLLLELKLCSPRDLRRCRSRVRRLTRQLPVFDSVWIDALVQARKLTPFQARILESPHPERLRVGPCVLVQQLGEGVNSQTYLARRREGNERCVVKLIKNTDDWSPQTQEQLDLLTRERKGRGHPSIVAPHAWNRFQGQLVTISRYVSGPHLGELLIRRGRFPAAIVLEIARQLLAGLVSREAEGQIHGDIRLCNVRMTSAGRAVLVDAGIVPVLTPELSIHSGLPPDRYDGTAPERIGTGQPPGVASDLYALGCLLWQLLAGRPPYPTGDPLAKLASHQTRRIEDVCRWAPDTPAILSEALWQFTAPDAEERPQSFDEALQLLGAPRRSGRKRLSRFRATFNTSAPPIPNAPSNSSLGPWPAAVTVLFLLMGASLSLLDEGARSEVLRLAGRFSPQFNGSVEKPDEESATSKETSEVDGRTTVLKPSDAGLIPLPAPNAQNVIELAHAGPYEAAEIAAVGSLTIRGSREQKAQIVVSGMPLKVWAEELTLENVHLRREEGAEGDNSGKSAGALLLVQAQNLVVRNASFQTSSFNRTVESASSSAAFAPERPAGIAWKLIDKEGQSGGNCLLENCVFASGGASVYLASRPRQIESRNCLQLGGGAFLSFSSLPTASENLGIRLDRLTLRRVDGLCRLNGELSSDGLGRLDITANNCVFDLEGDSSALFQLKGESVPSQWAEKFSLTGEGSLAKPGLEVARWLDTANSQVRVLDTTEMEVGGIAAGPFEYAGLYQPLPSQSAIDSYEAPRRSPDPPGIDAEGLSVLEED